MLIDNIYCIHNEISSYQAVIATMLNGCLTLSKIINIFTSIYKISYHKAAEKIKNLIDIVLEIQSILITYLEYYINNNYDVLYIF